MYTFALVSYKRGVSFQYLLYVTFTGFSFVAVKQGGRSIFAIVALVCLVQHLNGTVLLNATACYVVVKYCYGMELETHKWVE